MAAERLRRPHPRQTKNDDEALREIRQGRASPTIAFTLRDESGELTSLLERQIGAMNTDQRRHLKRALENVREAMHGNLEALKDLEDSSYRGLSGIIGVIIGGTLEAVTGVGSLTIGGAVTGLAIEQYLSQSSERHQLLTEKRLERCISLINRIEG